MPSSADLGVGAVRNLVIAHELNLADGGEQQQNDFAAKMRSMVDTIKEYGNVLFLCERGSHRSAAMAMVNIVATAEEGVLNKL